MSFSQAMWAFIIGALLITGLWRWATLLVAGGYWSFVACGVTYEMGKMPKWTPRIIMDLLSKYTNAPALKTAIEKHQKAELIDAAALAATIKTKVVGQDAVIDEVAQTIRRRLAMETREKPVGVFCFAGPPGVGKTELGKQFATNMKRGFLFFDMSQCNNPAGAQTLFGSPKGYVGSDAYGELTAGLRDQPKAVVLLDEFEKAHPDVMRRFLTAWNDGFVTEASDGKKIATNQAIFILTTNAAADRIGELADKITERDQLIKASKAALGEAGFPPEVLSRIDAVFAFKHIVGMDLVKLAVVQILAIVQGYGLEIAEDGEGIAWELLLDTYQRAGELQSAGGVREVVRAIEAKIVDHLIEAKTAGARRVRLVVDELGGLSVEHAG